MLDSRSRSDEEARHFSSVFKFRFEKKKKKKKKKHLGIMATKFWGGSSSESEEFEDSEEYDESSGDDSDDGGGGGNFGRFFSSSSDEGPRVVKSHKQKQLDQLEESYQLFKKSIGSNDWLTVLSGMFAKNRFNFFVDDF
jgi:hypothetical protein